MLRRIWISLKDKRNLNHTGSNLEYKVKPSLDYVLLDADCD